MEVMISIQDGTAGSTNRLSLNLNNHHTYDVSQRKPELANANNHGKVSPSFTYIDVKDGRQRGDHHAAGEPGIGSDVTLGDAHANLVEGFDVARQLVPARLQRAASGAPRSVELD